MLNSSKLREILRDPEEISKNRLDEIEKVIKSILSKSVTKKIKK